MSCYTPVIYEAQQKKEIDLEINNGCCVIINSFENHLGITKTTLTGFSAFSAFSAIYNLDLSSK